ncbi:unnamed protein product [Triticum turgidum subsp. durum]|uniref:Uncharacterized protein n=1 Tax=Triticum turgidum subsp. durum TaxID=4567 RepID=A0A9R0SDZ2_TRITD|nr:unnamed protein product [Triticum turgidum subsp. durum]
MGMAVLDEAQRRRRQSVYEFLDATKPARAQALRWCETAREMRRIDGDMKEAGQLLRGALSCVKDYASVYRTWIAMEMDGGGGITVEVNFVGTRTVGGGRKNDDIFNQFTSSQFLSSQEIKLSG